MFAPSAAAQVAAPAAQQTAVQSTQPTGSVTGRIVCADTQRPARFAEVTLVPVQDTSSNDEDERFGNRGRRGSGRTDLDGNFSIANVQPGDYYLSATATGYVSNAVTAFERASTNASDAASLLRGIPQVHVTANGTAQGSLSLERGGVVAGRLLWDDGSPAAGVAVNAASSTAVASLTRRGPNPLFQAGFGQGGQSSAQTDDRGSFRITGLPAGEYLLRATFAAPPPAGASAAQGGGFGAGRTVPITLYAPGKVRRGDAATITLAAGEERDDVVFTADLRALHSVAGRVSSASDVAVHSGSVRLVDTVDSSLSRSAPLNADGTFTVPYLPAGTYTLSANASSAVQGAGGRRGGVPSATPVTTFQPLQETLTVTDSDMTGLNLTVVPATAAATGAATASR